MSIFCAEFEKEIDRYYNNLRPTEDQLKIQNKLYKSIIECILKFQKENYPKQSWNIIKFGSYQFGINDNKSDIDIAIDLNIKTDKTLQIKILRPLYKIFEQIIKPKPLVDPILGAKRCPLISIEYRNKNIKIDVCISNGQPQKQQKFLKIINIFNNKYKYPIKKLIIFIKYWSKIRKINGSRQNKFM